MAEQTIVWVANDGKVKPDRNTHYLIQTAFRKAVAFWEKDVDGQNYWQSTEGHGYENDAVAEFAKL